MTCRVCGCTESTPCISPYGEACSWSPSDGTLCSFCFTTAAALAPWLLTANRSGRAFEPLFENLVLAAGQILVADAEEAQAEAHGGEPRIVIYGEADANAFLREMAAGAGGGR